MQSMPIKRLSCAPIKSLTGQIIGDLKLTTQNFLPPLQMSTKGAFFKLPEP